MSAEVGTLFGYYTKSIFDFPIWKAIGATIIGSFMFVFSEQSAVELLILLILVTVDTITSICASVKVGAGIKSRRLLDTPLKMALYFTLLMSVSLGDRVIGYILPFGLSIFKFAVSWLVIVELISIFENMERFGIKLPMFLLKFLKGKMKQIENESRRNISRVVEATDNRGRGEARKD